MQLRKHPIPRPSPIKGDSDPHNPGFGLNPFSNPINSSSSTSNNMWAGQWTQYQSNEPTNPGHIHTTIEPQFPYPYPKSFSNYDTENDPKTSFPIQASHSEPPPITQPITNMKDNLSEKTSSRFPRVSAPPPPPPKTAYPDLTPLENAFRSPVTQTLLNTMINQDNLQLTNIQSYFPNVVNLLRYYFNVSHRYVVHRLGFLLFPFYTIFKKIQSSNQYHSNEEHLFNMSNMRNGSNDRPEINPHRSVDFYIPLMALITYILLFGMAKGTSDEFRPDILGNQITFTLTILIIEVLLIKISYYFLRNSNINIFDLIAFSGYKFVHLALIIISGLLLTWEDRDTIKNPNHQHLKPPSPTLTHNLQPYFIYLFIMIYFSLCSAMQMSFYLNVHSASPQESNLVANTRIKNRLRFFIEIIFGIIQFPLCWLLVPRFSF